MDSLSSDSSITRGGLACSRSTEKNTSISFSPSIFCVMSSREEKVLFCVLHTIAELLASISASHIYSLQPTQTPTVRNGTHGMSGEPSPSVMSMESMGTAGTESDEFAQHIRFLFSALHFLCTHGLRGTQPLHTQTTARQMATAARTHCTRTRRRSCNTRWLSCPLGWCTASVRVSGVLLFG